MSGSNFALRFSVWEWLQVTLLAANLAWTTLCLGGYLPQTMAVTAALTAALLFVCGLAVIAGSRPAGGSTTVHSAPLVFLPFLAYATANVLWVSPVRWLAWFDWFGWVQMAVVFWVATNGIRTRSAQAALFATLATVSFISVLLACYQRFDRPDWLMLGRVQAEQYAGRASGSFGIPNSLAALLLLVLPVTAALAFRRTASALARVFFGWLTAVLAFGLVLTISRGAWLGLALGAAAWPLLAIRGSRWRRVGVAAGALVAAAMAFGILCSASPAVRERFTQLVRDAGERSRPILWRAALRLFEEHPVAGTGAGTFNLRFEAYRPEGFLPEPHWAHNDYLNTLSDYGTVGFALSFGVAAAIALLVFRRLGERRPRVERLAVRRLRPRGDVFDDPIVLQALAVGLLAFALQLFVDFHFKIPALGMAFATVAGILVARTSRPGEFDTTFRPKAAVTIGALLAVGALAIAVFVVPSYRAEALRVGARDMIERLGDGPAESRAAADLLPRARAELERAVALAPGNAQAWADRAYALAQASRFEPQRTKELGREAEHDADRALAVSGALNAEFWIRRGVARDMQGRWAEAGDDFNEAIARSPRSALPWYHYAYHLSLHPAEHDLAMGMVVFCLRLDPKNPDGVRLRQRLASIQPGP